MEPLPLFREPEPRRGQQERQDEEANQHEDALVGSLVLPLHREHRPEDEQPCGELQELGGIQREPDHEGVRAVRRRDVNRRGD